METEGRCAPPWGTGYSEYRIRTRYYVWRITVWCLQSSVCVFVSRCGSALLPPIGTWGLGLRARASGRRTWIVRRRVGHAVVKRTRSSADAMSVENAMAATMRRWRCRRCGSLGRRSSRTAPGVRSRQPRQRMRTTCSGPSPAFGNRRVDAVTARNVRNWFDDLSVTRAATCEPVVDGAVVPEEARRIFGAAAEGVEPLSRWWSTASRFAA